jgi:hypothetical protein
MINRQLGSYTIIEPLGAGGMGEVYRAHDSKLDRDVAIKILPSRFILSAERRTRFAREARVLATLNHPHIGAIYGLEESGGATALVLELVEGPTLAQRLLRGPLPVPEALLVAQQIAKALAAAHEKGIVHRDLKPGNVVLQPVGGTVSSDVCAKVLDFGLAKTLALDEDAGRTISIDRTADGRILGTPAYMSPEQARGQAVDARTDVWAFGCVLYEMLAGRQVFHGATASDIIAKILERDPDWEALPEATPASIRRLLRRCLEKDPKSRLHSIADANLDLEEARGDKPVESGGVRTRGGLKVGRRLLSPGLMVLLAVLVIALLAVLIEYRRTELRLELRQSAETIFYDLRALEGNLVRLRRLDPASSDVRQAIYRRNRLTETSDDYVERLGLYDGKSPAERAVLRMARRLGEADLDVPAGFVQLTTTWVQRWSSSRALQDAIARGRKRNLIQPITTALQEKGLPRELLFLALVESHFDPSAVGPQTRHGVPKGLWQLTPDLAERYGLILGPRRGEPRFDPADERHDERRSTEAVVNYLADLYSSEAAASTLLVMASYNSGEDAVIERLESLPADPRERTFWNFYKNGWLSAQTQDFVVAIFAAALVCQEPETFGAPMEKIW